MKMGNPKQAGSAGIRNGWKVQYALNTPGMDKKGVTPSLTFQPLFYYIHASLRPVSVLSGAERSRNDGSSSALFNCQRTDRVSEPKPTLRAPLRAELLFAIIKILV